MPTYTFRCEARGELLEHVMGIAAYHRAPPTFVHCGHLMQRWFHVNQLQSNSQLITERHYDGLRAPDGTDISSRAKHRAYMREHNVTTVDDFRDTWAKQEQQRVERIGGVDPARARDIAQAIHKLGG